jgi:hypothetical protein
MEMDRGPERRSEYADHGERKAEARDEAVEEAAGPHRPTCPQCGWHNTRLSHTRGVLDSVLRGLSLRAFRCRSCGNRFRAFRRSTKG